MAEAAPAAGLLANPLALMAACALVAAAACWAAGRGHGVPAARVAWGGVLGGAAVAALLALHLRLEARAAAVGGAPAPAVSAILGGDAAFAPAAAATPYGAAYSPAAYGAAYAPARRGARGACGKCTIRARAVRARGACACGIRGARAAGRRPDVPPGRPKVSSGAHGTNYASSGASQSVSSRASP